jgi:hypothetical protein
MRRAFRVSKIVLRIVLGLIIWSVVILVSIGVIGFGPGLFDAGPAPNW